jgi:hypothetical protein
VKKLTKIFFLLFILSPFVFSQNNDSIKINLPDSLKINNQKNPLTELQIKFDEFELHRELNSLKMNIPIDGDPNTVWLRTSLLLSKSDKSIQDFSPHFLSPLERKYHEDSKFNPIKYVLGAAQVGAVGYLAYKHIKKYGFLK